MTGYSKTSNGVDRIFLGIVIALVASGFIVFLSASLGLLSREGARLSSIAGSQLMGIALGTLLGCGASFIHYRAWRRFSPYLLLVAVALTLLVFVPGIGVSHGGAFRWLDIAGFSFQPAEFLKIGFVVFFAAFLSSMREKAHIFRYGLLPFFLLVAAAGAILLSQPDTDSFVILTLTLFALFLVAGAPLRHLALAAFVGLALFAGLVAAKPYLKERVMTYLKPEAADSQGARWQIDQSLIAIGSGGGFGRGFGQSVQKFSYLPEPVGDSIFAVASEEFGFAGALALIALFLAFLMRGLRIATHAPDSFGGLLALGIVILISLSAFVNIASMLGLIPLSGLPLPFVSHGGTAMLITLAEVGIVLNISRYQRN
jgi:cell division protein FtsW